MSNTTTLKKELVSPPALEIRQISPVEAAAYLGVNTKNRSLSSRTVKKYARDMKDGRFSSLNGETIKMSKTGRLLDGQHRMQAVIAAEVTLPFMVVDGLEDESFSTIDTGKNRGAGDVLFVETGVANANRVSAALKIIDKVAEVGHFSDGNPRVPNWRVLELYEQYPDVVNVIGFVQTKPFLMQLGTPSLMAAIIYVLSTLRDPEEVQQFFTMLDTGTELAEDSPLLVLRDRLISLRMKRGAGFHRFYVEISNLVLSAYRLWAEGKSCKHLIGQKDPIIVAKYFKG